MALIERSTLVTAPSATKVSGYELKINGKVNTNDLVVNNKADELKSKIEASYKNLNKYFSAIASEYKKCAKQSVKGTKLVTSLKKVAKNCENQGKYCLNRKKQLDTLYKKAQSEAYTRELDAAIDGSDGSSSDLNKDLDMLEKNPAITDVGPESGNVNPPTSSSGSSGNTNPPASSSDSSGNVNPPASSSGSSGNTNPPTSSSGSSGNVNPPASSSGSNGNMTSPPPSSSSDGSTTPPPPGSNGNSSTSNSSGGNVNLSFSNFGLGGDKTSSAGNNS